MRRLRQVTCVPALLALAACASGPTNPSPAAAAETKADTRAETPAAGAQGVTLGALSNPTLPNGACGMLLWTTEGEAAAPVLIFRYVSGGGAQANVNGKTIELARTETAGSSGFGVAERQTFTSGAGLTIETSVTFGSAFDGGVWLQNGFVAAQTADGWRMIAPSAGIAGCRAK